MGLQHIAAKIDEDNRRQAQHETFGHLFPGDSRVFEGTIRLAKGEYGDYVILSDHSGVPASPWWFDALQDFMFEFLREHDSPGKVFEVRIKCEVVRVPEEGKGARKLEITKLSHKVVL